MRDQAFRARDGNIQKAGHSMGSLSSHNAVMELISLMRQNGRKPQAMELSYMVSAIDNMEKRYSELLSTVQDMRNQLSDLAGQNDTFTDQVSDLIAYWEVQTAIEQVLPLFASAKETVIAQAKTAVADYAQTGVSGLDAALSALNIRGMVKTLRKQAYDSALNIIGSMLQAEKEGRFHSSVLAPIRALQKAMQFISGAAREPKKCPEEKPSVRQALKKNQSEIAANSTPTPDKGQKKEATL